MTKFTPMLAATLDSAARLGRHFTPVMGTKCLILNSPIRATKVGNREDIVTIFF